MAEKIINVDYAHFRREEQHSFHDRVMQIVLNTCGKCGKAYDRFEAAAKSFDALLVSKGLAPSLSLEALDMIADDAWRSMSLQLGASLVHPRQGVREAAAKVDAVFSKTPNPTRLGFDEEYGALSTLLSQLAQLDADTLKAALVDEHVQALQAAVEDFIVASTDKLDALAKVQAGQIKEVSAGCFAAWKALARYIEMMASLDELPGASEAIAQLNAMNAAIKRRQELRKANKSVGNIVEMTDADAEA